MLNETYLDNDSTSAGYGTKESCENVRKFRPDHNSKLKYYDNIPREGKNNTE